MYLNQPQCIPLAVRTQHGRLLRILYLFLGSVSVSLLRVISASGDSFQSVWAEDGWMPLCVVANGHGSCLDEQVNGYWPIIHRLLAEVFALLPMSLWPLLFPLGGAILTGAVATVTYLVIHRFTGEFFGVIASLALVLIPFLGMEYINVVGNIHWALLIVGMLTILKIDSVDEPGLAIMALLFFAATANPAGFVLVTYLAVLATSRVLQRRPALLLGGAALTGWTIQMVAIQVFGGSERVGTSFTFEEKLTAFANSILSVVPGMRVFSNTPVSFLSVSTRLLPVLIATSIFMLLVWLALNRSRALITRRIAAFGLNVQILGAFLLLILDENPRYVYVVVALNTVWVVALIGSQLQLQTVGRVLVVGICALLWLPGFPAGPYRTTPSDVAWDDQLERAEAACMAGAETVVFHFAPERNYETEVHCDAITD